MAEKTGTSMHTHVGVLIIGTTFVGVLIMGTLWRLTAAHLAVSPNPQLQQVGKAMSFQY